MQRGEEGLKMKEKEVEKDKKETLKMTLTLKPA